MGRKQQIEVVLVSVFFMMGVVEQPSFAYDSVWLNLLCTT